LSDPDAIILGAFAQLPEGTNQVRNYNLAVAELTDTYGGFRATGGGERFVVMVVCEAYNASRGELNASANHLINELKVPGIVSELEAEDLRYVFTEYAQAQSTFIVSAVVPDEQLVNTQTDGLLWHALSSAGTMGVTYGPLLERTLAYLGTTGALGATEKARVALIVPAGEPRVLRELGQTVEDTIEFNGLSAADNGANFEKFTIITAFEDPNASQVSLANQLRDFAPHVVIPLGSIEVLTGLIPAIEAGWTKNGAQARPFYLLSPYVYNAQQMQQLVSSRPAIRERVAGVNWPAAEDPAIYDEYLAAFDAANSDVAGRADTRGYENFYDAAYYLLYAIAAKPGSAPLNGAGLATGMTRLMSGTEYAVGSRQMEAAFNHLRSSPTAKLKLIGAMGPPNFDALTGTRLDAGSVWCYDSSNIFRADVLRYDPSAAMLLGTFPCISGF
jgi:hypothetical protein